MLLIIAIASVLLYAAFMFFVFARTKVKHIAGSQSVPNVSIIIPCRNEENTIAHCLNSIAAQSLAADYYEIIVVNDDSNDETLKKLNSLHSTVKFKVINSQLPGKKSAIEAGIQQAQFDIIYTVDADCTLHPQCLETMVNDFHNNQFKMICGLVNFTEGNGLFGTLQQTESAAIVGISAAMLNSGLPATCNGANLMFSKQSFYESGGYSGHKHLATGDDDLLMHEFYKRFGNKVRYCFHPFATVYTAPAETFLGFLKQRSRWLTKSNQYRLPWNNVLQLMVSLHLIAFYFLLIFLLISFSWGTLFIICVKYLSDFLVAWPLKKVLKFNTLAILIIPFYQMYIGVVLLYALTGQTDWKGRRSVLSDFK
ncbi:MAG: glycosyltransferase [Bacteroidota bacterium]